MGWVPLRPKEKVHKYDISQKEQISKRYNGMEAPENRNLMIKKSDINFVKGE